MNTYSIKPNLVTTKVKADYFDRQKEHFKTMDSHEITKQVLGLVAAIIASYFSTTFGIVIFVFVLLIVIYYNATIWAKVENKRKESERQRRSKESDLKKENTHRTKLAEEMSIKLNGVLDKSTFLVTKGLAIQLDSISSTLERIKFEFNENALIPFWDEIEIFVKRMNSYKETLNSLEKNRKLYYQIIHSTENNFPKEFPSKLNKERPEKLINDFKFIQREAFKKFEFANLWEQRKTQKVLAFGFSNLQSAINNMSHSIESAIYNLNNNVISLNKNVVNLNNNVVSGQEHLSEKIKSLKLSNVNNVEKVNKTLEKNLSDIDSKLYFIQYNKVPFEPFKGDY
ncbi:hypothetical protein [Psychroserpens sp. SPM9]|uniref:hypothetical protein n=1 Tax=Psychroserpens sp. SPM9 TaxID=2975598 RepID=UPI0021A3AAC8|nr:hypothetical protein [Psychroserpens sp. SPM9]MDG5493249.1 hypothetical protein [Psychroserpens sp. SPM9]